MRDKNYISKNEFNNYKAKTAGMIAGITTFFLLSSLYCGRCAVQNYNDLTNQNAIDSIVVEEVDLEADSLPSLKSDLELKIKSYNK